MPTAHIKHAMTTPVGIIAAGLAAAALLPVEICCEPFVNSDPQYHSATT